MSTRKSIPRPRPPVAGGSADRPVPPVVKRRVYLVDDHPMTRLGLGANINRQADLEVCGEAGSPAEAMTALAKFKPDLMVTDMTMPGRSGTEFIKDVHALQPDLPILVLSLHNEMLFAERALRAGARGYLMKDAGAVRILEVIRQILDGKAYVSPQMAEQMLESLTRQRPRNSSSPVANLSDREFEVFQLLGSGKGTKEVAAALHLSAKTVDVHRAHIRDKLHLKDAASVFHHAVRWVEAQATPGSEL